MQSRVLEKGRLACGRSAWSGELQPRFLPDPTFRTMGDDTGSTSHG